MRGSVTRLLRPSLARRRWADSGPRAGFGPQRGRKSPLALCRPLGERAGRPRCAACSLAQMPLWRTMGMARPPGRERVTLQHARILPAAQRSHPPRQGGVFARLRGSPGLDLPHTKSPAAKACGGRSRRAFWGAEAHRACGQRAARSSTCSSPLSERRERSERSEFGDAAARPSTAGQSARSAPDRPSEAPRPVPTRLAAPRQTRRTRYQRAPNCELQAAMQSPAFLAGSARQPWPIRPDTLT